MFSIIIPTYNEEENIGRLIKKLFKCLERPYEIIVVDKDSEDNTKKIVEGLAEENPVRLIIDRDSLAEAIIAGIKKSRGEKVLVMDADFSHPPEKVPLFFQKLKRDDMIIGTRKKVENWPWHRKVISKGATFLVRPLTNVKDPMSGFFGFKKKLLKGTRLNPIGYKILLEILVKAAPKNKSELLYVFKNREKGESKLDLGEYLYFLRHLGRLYWYKIFSFHEKLF